MHDYEFVPRREVSDLRNDLIDILNEVQDIVRPSFTFRYDFNVGSGAHNLVTRQVNGNQGFDLDCNIRVNDDEEKYNPGEIKHILVDAFNRVSLKYGFNYCEDETRVFSIKVRDNKDAKILYGCDFAIVNDYTDENGKPCQEYIRHIKTFTPNPYEWEEQPDEYYSLQKHITYCKKYGLQGEIRDEYLRLKCLYGPAKKSMQVYAEAYNNIYQRHIKK